MAMPVFMFLNWLRFRLITFRTGYNIALQVKAQNCQLSAKLYKLSYDKLQNIGHISWLTFCMRHTTVFLEYKVVCVYALTYRRYDADRCILGCRKHDTTEVTVTYFWCTTQLHNNMSSTSCVCVPTSYSMITIIIRLVYSEGLYWLYCTKLISRNDAYRRN